VEEEKEAGVNKGKLLIDATCVPADIRYPTDLSLLNESREKLEKIIDVLHAPHVGKRKKVRTYRREARKEYLKVAKRRKPSYQKVRKGIRKQLQYIARNLRSIKELKEETPLEILSKKQYRDLLVISELFRQQKEMYEEKKHSIEGRIVSISQPHVRPIVRGKVTAEVEFGAKLSLSMVDGYTFLDRLSWENYNESGDLISQIEKFKDRFGYYPESVHVDKIYRNRKNRKYCKEHEIRISGPPLGRPPKEREEYKRIMKEAYLDEKLRIPIEGKIGNGKRKYGLDRIKTKLKNTSETVIGVTVLVMNLEKILRDFLLSNFLWLLRKTIPLRGWMETIESVVQPMKIAA
jgi:hypothetical protein